MESPTLYDSFTKELTRVGTTTTQDIDLGQSSQSSFLNTTSIASGSMMSGTYEEGVSGWKLDADGNLYANNGTFKGDITGATGTFTGTVTVGSLNIPDTTTANSFHVNTAGDAWWGATTIGSATAKVLKTGVATFTNVTATGTINATGGFIGSATALVYESQGINCGVNGHIRGGATDYLTDTGFYLGYTGGEYKFSVGDPAGEHIAWDGSVFDVSVTTTYKVALPLGETINAGDPVKAIHNAGILTAYKLFNKYYPGTYIPIENANASSVNNRNIDAVGTDGSDYIVISSEDADAPWTISVFKIDGKEQIPILLKSNLNPPDGYKLNYIGYDSTNDKFILVSTEDKYWIMYIKNDICYISTAKTFTNYDANKRETTGSFDTNTGQFFIVRHSSTADQTQLCYSLKLESGDNFTVTEVQATFTTDEAGGVFRGVISKVIFNNNLNYHYVLTTSNTAAYSKIYQYSMANDGTISQVGSAYSFSSGIAGFRAAGNEMAGYYDKNLQCLIVIYQADADSHPYYFKVGISGTTLTASNNTELSTTHSINFAAAYNDNLGYGFISFTNGSTHGLGSQNAYAVEYSGGVFSTTAVLLCNSGNAVSAPGYDIYCKYSNCFHQFGNYVMTTMDTFNMTPDNGWQSIVLVNKNEPIDPINNFVTEPSLPRPYCDIDTINNKIIYVTADGANVIAICGQINSDKTITWGAAKNISTENTTLCGICWAGISDRWLFVYSAPSTSKYILELRSISTVTISNVVATSDLDTSVTTPVGCGLAYNPISNVSAVFYCDSNDSHTNTRQIITNSDDTLTIGDENTLNVTTIRVIKPYRSSGSFWLSSDAVQCIWYPNYTTTTDSITMTTADINSVFRGITVDEKNNWPIATYWNNTDNLSYLISKTNTRISFPKILTEEGRLITVEVGYNLEFLDENYDTLILPIKDASSGVTQINTLTSIKINYDLNTILVDDKRIMGCMCMDNVQNNPNGFIFTNYFSKQVFLWDNSNQTGTSIIGNVLDRDNYIGICDESGTVGQSKNIDYPNSSNTDITGLTVGQFYWLGNYGLTTTPTNYKAGYAKDATHFIIVK